VPAVAIATLLVSNLSKWFGRGGTKGTEPVQGTSPYKTQTN